MERVALVKALTGVDPDRLPEEKARGLTIDLGFASFCLRSPRGISPAAEFQIGVIDVPGHEDFVRNMVAGVGSIDAALLVVAADDGWMPQTEEHFRILAHLGVTRGVVALSKIDLAANESLSIGAVRDRLRGTPFEEATIVPTSIESGRGIEELKLALRACFRPRRRNRTSASLGFPWIAFSSFEASERSSPGPSPAEYFNAARQSSSSRRGPRPGFGPCRPTAGMSNSRGLVRALR